MPSRYTDRIIQHMAHGVYKPSVADAIARDMRIEGDDRAVFDDAIQELVEGKRVLVDERNGLIRLPAFGKEVVGRIRVNKRGFGFVIAKETYADGDLFIPADNIGDAVTGDTVRAEVMKRSGRGRPGTNNIYGRIIEITERGQTSFVGLLVHERRQWTVQPDGRRLTGPVIIRDPHAKNAKAGDKVVFELLQYPDGDYLAEGVITEVLGEAGRPDVETQAVIAAHGLREGFSETLLNEARARARTFDIEAPPESFPDREDLTDTFTMTIDPPDARDFDDAITLEFDRKKQQWTLGVHIADVSHFVEPKSNLDVEATARANSVYLPRHVIPMLPEVLSNGVCSLQEGVNRLARSAFITYDTEGKVLSQRVAATIICSNKRLTYLEAQALIDGDATEAAIHTRSTPVYSPELIDKLELANRLARTLRRRRQRDGMIVLDLPDVELVYDEDGHVIDAVPEDDAYTHTIIEMFMVEANEAVARIFNSLHVPLLRRIHPDPVHGDMTELRMYARVADFSLPENPNRFDLQRLLESTHGTPASRAVHFAVLRTLTKAEYSPSIIGHFALASNHYAHFTSPIRRYPDLLVHRVVKAYTDLTNNGKDAPKNAKQREALGRKIRQHELVADEGELIEMGRHCSEMEVNAAAAERELREFLVLQFLSENHLGDEFDGTVTGVNNRGVFVSIERYLAEGMVDARELPQSRGKPDRWGINESTGRLVAGRSGASIGIGDVVRVRIVAIDLSSRHLDLVISKLSAVQPTVGAPKAERGKARSKSGAKHGAKRKTGKRGGKSKAKAGKRSRKRK